MDPKLLQMQLDKNIREKEVALRKLEEAELKTKRYYEAAQKAYEEVEKMQNQLQSEQRCLETAVQVASKLYSRNTELKRISTRRKTVAFSRHQQAWKDLYEKSGELEEEKTTPSVDENGNEKFSVNSQEIENLDDDEIKEGDADDLDAIAVLDKKSKSDLESALEEVNKLRKINQDMQAKQTITEEMEKVQQTTIDQLQAVIQMKDEELKTLQEKFDVESEVRQRAETYAARMYGKQKAFQRKSVLIKSAGQESFDENLQKAMKDLDKKSEEMEQERMKHKQEIQKLEEKLTDALVGEEKKEIDDQISLLKIGNEQLELDKQKLEETNAALRKELEMARGDMVLPGAPVPPPPVAPPPPPPIFSTVKNGDPAKSIYQLIAERKAANKRSGSDGATSTKKTSAQNPVCGYANAMAEMMRRIKLGTALRKPSAETSPPVANADSQTSGDKCNSDEWDSSDDSADEAEYDHIYSHVGKAEKGKEELWDAAPDVGTAGKWATIGAYGAKTSADTKADGTSFGWGGLTPVKTRNQSVEELKKDLSENQTPTCSRDSVFQDSVKLPKDINPDLKKILDKRRMGMKRAQTAPEKPQT